MATPLALQLYTVRKALAEDRSAALARVAEMGFRAVEPFGIGAPGKKAADRLADARELRAELDRFGLRAVAAHGYVTSDITADRVFDELETLGIDRLIAPVPGLVSGADSMAMTTAAGVARLAEGLNAGAERAAERGIKVGYHNHDFEWGELEDGTTAYDAMVRQLDPQVFLEVDVYWTYTGGQDPARVVGVFSDRVHILHVKDGPGVRGELQTPIGSGEVDNVAAIHAGANVEWHVVELDDTAGDPFEVARDGAAWLVEQGESRWEP